MPSPSPSDLRCQAAALRYAAKRAHKRSIIVALLARARRLEAEAILQERGGHKLTFSDAALKDTIV